jgi:hypothetical protein
MKGSFRTLGVRKDPFITPPPVRQRDPRTPLPPFPQEIRQAATPWCDPPWCVNQAWAPAGPPEQGETVASTRGDG